ncbi:calcium-binding protein, partial [Pseudooceanicola sp.]|uniref:calcium-binding protein n=1 Tax=Pseudooceanicola sp. TaxID=1914328 RepID=UPI004058F414
MAVYTVGAGLSFEAAVSAANESAEADIIRFANSGVMRLGDMVTISGQLTIEGDRDNDGVSDVMLRAADGERHLTISHGAEVTIFNVDFVGGRDVPRTWDGNGARPTAASGAPGTWGTLTEAPGFDGANGNDDARHGAPGTDGDDGVEAAGAIMNSGTLTLVRAGFGRNQAIGEIGQRAGAGGYGGSSQGGDGESDTWTELRSGAYYGDQRYMRDNLIAGGLGGDGGNGGYGGDGADGGDGGDAGGAIYNEGRLVLVDTVFGGRLSSGTLVASNLATGGNAGSGGGGGSGGSSRGGDGGNSGMGLAGSRFVEWEIPEGLWDEDWADPIHSPVAVANEGQDNEQRFIVVRVYQEITNEAGVGGNGGIGGNGGDGGDGGRGGHAATILNTGRVEGLAAVAVDRDPDNLVTAGNGGNGGAAGAGGGSFGGEGGLELGPAERLDHYGVLTMVTGDSFWERSHDSPFVNAIREELRSWDLEAPGVTEFPITGQAAYGSAGPYGTAGTLGSPGRAGNASTGIVSDEGGASAATVVETMVYLYDMGQNPDTGLLSFNIIRIGNPLSAFTINWALTGDGGAPVSAADFAPGTALSGTVSFDVAQITQENADGTYEERFQHASDAPTNIRRVELEVAGDLLDEVPEGYRITLTGGAGAPLLGTHVASGTLIDTMLTPGGPIMGTPGPDILDGTAGPDEIVGLDGADVLRGLGGDDTLEGGDGPDTLVGGDGNDRLIGGNSAADLRDLIYGGEGQDSIDGGYGNDELRGDAGNDTITGGAGVDTIIGGVGDDVLTGQTWSDVILGGNGRDFINGGFG